MRLIRQEVGAGGLTRTAAATAVIATILIVIPTGIEMGSVPAAAQTGWSAPEVPLPQPQPPTDEGGGGVTVSDVSCPGVGSCVAVGQFTAWDQTTQRFLNLALIDTLSDDSWQGTTAPLPSNAATDEDVELNSVTCVSPGNCVAVGEYVDPLLNQYPLIDVDTNGSWTNEPVLLPSNAGARDAPYEGIVTQVNAVSCSSIGNCEAVGYYSAGYYNELGLIETETNGSWTPVEAPLPSDATGITGNGAPNAALGSVSCPGPGTCMASGDYYSSSGYQGVIDTLTNGTWQPTELTVPAAYIGDLSLPSISCASVSSCAAVGSIFTGEVVDPSVLATLSSGVWTMILAPTTDIAPSSYAEAVSCPQPGVCFAVGGTYGPNVYVWSLASGNWSVSSIAAPDASSTQTNPSAISCPTTTSCVAVGVNYPGNDLENTDGLIDVMNNGAWTALDAPEPADAVTTAVGNASLHGISCPAAGDCAAVGYYVKANGDEGSLIDTLGSTSPSVPSYVALGDSYSSGEGNPPFFEPTNTCDRSEIAYPTLVQNSLTPGKTWFSERNSGSDSWGFLACSGATTTDMMKFQVTSTPDSSNTNWVPLSASTSLVTITAGGDDVGWTAVLKQCYKRYTGCENKPFGGYKTMNAYANAQLKALAPNLVSLYQHIRGLAPNAEIIVLGYPQLLPKATAAQDCLVLHGDALSHALPPTVYRGLNNDEQNWFRSEETALNNTIQTAVGTSGTGAIFQSVTQAFAGHAICGALGQWINGVTFSFENFTFTPATFHPNQSGLDGYASVVNQFLTSIG